MAAALRRWRLSMACIELVSHWDGGRLKDLGGGGVVGADVRVPVTEVRAVMRVVDAFSMAPAAFLCSCDLSVSHGASSLGVRLRRRVASRCLVPRCAHASSVSRLVLASCVWVPGVG